jgi:FtsZ-binding cell division protein ZapB
LKTNICTLKESNTKLAIEVSHLQASIDELREEVAPLKEDNNYLFDEYQALKEDYDSILLQLTKKDVTIQGLHDCKYNLQEEIHRL